MDGYTKDRFGYELVSRHAPILRRKKFYKYFPNWELSIIFEKKLNIENNYEKDIACFLDSSCRFRTTT